MRGRESLHIHSEGENYFALPVLGRVNRARRRESTPFLSLIQRGLWLFFLSKHLPRIRDGWKRGPGEASPAFLELMPSVFPISPRPRGMPCKVLASARAARMFAYDINA